MNTENKREFEFSGDEKRLRQLVYLADKLRPDAYEEIWVMIASFVYRLMLVRDKKTGEIDIMVSQRLTRDICLKFWERLCREHPAKNESILQYVASFCRWHKERFLVSPEGSGLEDAANSRSDLPYTQPEQDVRPLWKTQRKHKAFSDLEFWDGKTLLDKIIRQEDRVRLRQIKLALRQAIAELDPVEEYVIYARFFDRLPYDTISERLEGDTQKTVYYRKVCELSINKLKRLLQEKYGIKQLPEQEI